MSCENKPVDISSVFIDHEEAGNKTTWIINENEILIPKSEMEIGDRIAVTFNKQSSASNEVLLLSALNKEIYKSLDLELEFAFVKKEDAYPQNIEIVARAVNRWNKTFVVDEYYSFGLQDGRIYFAKTSYHEEGEEDSFAYKEMLNLGGDEAKVFFKDLSLEQIDQLGLDPETGLLKYNTKYKLKAEMKDDSASFYIKEVSESVSQAIEFPWIPLFEGIKLVQDEENISRRDVPMKNIVSAPEPIAPLTEAGLYGLAFPNSFARIYRFEIVPRDVGIGVKLYNDEEYSKNVATDFNITYRNENVIKMNASDSKEDNTSIVIEYFDVDGKQIQVNENLKREDINFIEVNNVSQKLDEHYIDKFIDIQSQLSDSHLGTTLLTNIDPDDKDVIAQQDQYFELGQGDGLSEDFELPQEAIDKLKMYPNARVAAVMVEAPFEVTLNEFSRVGLQENPQQFFTRNDIIERFSGQGLYMETIFRGKRDYFHMGQISDGKFAFDIDPEFLKPNDTYSAIWKYNLANFINDFSADNPIFSTVLISGELIPPEFDNINEVPLNLDDVWIHPESIGYVIAKHTPNDIAVISRSELEYSFLLGSENIPDDIQILISRGFPIADLRALLKLFQEVEVQSWKDMVVNASIVTLDFREYFETLAKVYGISVSPYENYLDFRETWIRDLEFNMHSSANEIDERNIYLTKELNDDVFVTLSEGIVSFKEPVDAGKLIVIRIYYENFVNLTTDYDNRDTFYFVPDNIKELYNYTDREKGPDDLIENIDSGKYQEIKQGDITYVIVPKNLIRADQELIATLSVCSPFIESDDGVKRLLSAPLRPVSELVNSGFETTQTGIEYNPEADDVLGQNSFYNREFDNIIELNEILEGDWADNDNDVYNIPITGYVTVTGGISGNPNIGISATDEIQVVDNVQDNVDYEYDFPKSFPMPDFVDIEPGNVPETIDNWDNSIDNPLTHGLNQNETFFLGLLDGDVVSDFLVDKYLNVSKWFNTDNNRLSDFNRAVLKNIISIMSKNRTIGAQEPLPSDADPLDINNWFSGFYSGEKTPWEDTWNSPKEASIDDNLDFGRFRGNPWGDQNSRKQLIDQLKQAGENRFEDFSLYYIDISKVIDHNKTILNGINSNFIDPEKYPTSGVDQFLRNPFVDRTLQDYQPYTDVFNDNGELVYSKDDFSKFTNPRSEYVEEGRNAFSNLNILEYRLEDVLRKLTNGIDISWDFNSSIMFGSQTGNILSEGTKVNAEYSYFLDENKGEENNLDKISQKVVLGTARGIDNEKFPNPDIGYISSVKRADVHNVWLDSYKLSDSQYEIKQIDDQNIRLDFSANAQFEDGFDVSMSYSHSNYLDQNVENLFVDNFSTRRDFKWTTLTQDRIGYIKTDNDYSGMVADSELFVNDVVWRRESLTTDAEGDPLIKTSGSAISKEIIFGLQTGLDVEETLELVDIERYNNFEISTNIYFDLDIERREMATGIIFRGGFNFINNERFLNEYYAVIVNSENANISLIAVANNEDGVHVSQELAKVNDSNAIIKRGQWYTLTFSVIKDVVKVFLNERNQDKKFYFEYNLNSGRVLESTGVILEETLPGGLGVTYEDPEFVLTGNRIGITSRSSKIYFSDFKLRAFEESNLRFNDSFNITKYDDLLSSLKNINNISGNYRKMRKTIDGYIYLQIGNSLFAKRGEGTFIIHSMVVDDFEVIDDHIYVVERLIPQKRAVINVYTKLFELVNDLRVNGTNFINEPVFSYIKDFDKEVSKIEKVGNDLYVTFILDERAKTWLEFNDATWDELDEFSWDLHG